MTGAITFLNDFRDATKIASFITLDVKSQGNVPYVAIT